MSRAPRNQDRDAEIIARIKAGEPFPAIAQTMGVTTSVVRSVCYRAGLSDPQRHAAATKANWQDPEFRERHAAATKANWQDPEFRERNAAATKANWQDPEFRERNAAATKANWQDPEFRERNAAATKAAKAQQLCDRYGLRPDELDDFRAIKRGGFKPDEAARMIIASRKSEAA